MTTENPFARDSQGLLTSVNYLRKPNGAIDWRGMINPSFLYINPDYEVELKTRFNVKNRRDIDPTKVEDHQLLITLGGWQELLRLRGYKSLRYPIMTSRDGYAAVTCEIEFIGNFETNGQPIIHSDSASASLYSVTDQFQLFLESMATNRAFARCIRTFLNIPIYGKDEFDPEANKAFKEAVKSGNNPLIAPKQTVESQGTSSATTGVGLLKDKCQNRKKPISFEMLKVSANKIKADLTSDPQSWESFDNIPPLDSYTLLTNIERADSAAKTK